MREKVKWDNTSEEFFFFLTFANARMAVHRGRKESRIFCGILAGTSLGTHTALLHVPHRLFIEIIFGDKHKQRL